MAKKPTRVRYSGIAPFVDDTQVNRVQAFGSSSRLTTEDVKELGTLNIVEIVDDVPQVDISIDQNENGTNDLLALLSNKGYGCNVVAVPNGGNLGSTTVKVLPGSYMTSAGHRIAFEGTTITSPTSGNQTVFVRPEVSGGASAKVGITGGSIPAGAVSLATFTGNSIITQSTITDTRSFSTITALDFELANVDIFVPVKQSGSGDVVARTMYMERAFANSVDLSFQTSGVATIGFKLETDNKRWFLNDSSQLIVDNIKAGAGTTLVLTQVPTVLANGNKLLKLIKNGTPLIEGTDFTVVAATKTVTFTQALVAGDLIKARYVALANTLAGTYFAPVPAIENPHPELAGGLKQGQIELYLSDNTTTRVARVNSARISMPLTREQLMELGSLKPYDRPMQLPVGVTVSLEFKDSDLEMFARLSGFDINVNTTDEISLDDLVKNMGLVIKLYRETDTVRAKLPAGHPNKYAVKTYSITNLIPQSENWDARVDSDATQSFEFLAHNLTISDKLV